MSADTGSLAPNFPEFAPSLKTSLKGRGYVKCLNVFPFPRSLVVRLEAILSAADSNLLFQLAG